MSLYRCAICGSSRIVSEQKQEGYNMKKGIIGSVLFGRIGALAGAHGNFVSYYHCGECGQVLNYTMSNVEKEAIDSYIQQPSVYKELLKNKKQKYRNIEWQEEDNCKINNSNLDVSDIAELLLDYIKKEGMPVKVDSEKIANEIGLNYNDFPYGKNNKFHNALLTLLDQGIIKSEIIGENRYLVLVTDVKEMKELVFRRKAVKEVENILKNEDYIKNLKEKLIENLPKCFMSLKEIYDFIESNNYLSDDVIRAVEKNPFVSTYFANRCIMKLEEVYKPVNGRWRDITRIRLYGWKGEGDNIMYRMKTLEELEEEKQPVKDWRRVK